MTPRDAVLASARTGLRVDTAEEGFAEIRRRTGAVCSDAELAEAVARLVAERVILDPVRLVPGALQCFWKLEGFSESPRKLSQIADIPYGTITT